MVGGVLVITVVLGILLALLLPLAGYVAAAAKYPTAVRTLTVTP